MSLLMKALEKAAKDRGETRNEHPAPAAVATAAAPARSELSLEPMAAEAAQLASRTETTARPSAAPRAAPAAPTPAREQAQAGTILQAQSTGRASGGAGAYVREHPVMVFGTLAGLVAVAFGIYVYLQIFHPAMFVARPAPAPKGPLPPLSQAPVAPVAPAPVAPALPSALVLKEGAAEPAPATTPVAETPRAKPQLSAVPPQETAPRDAISISKGSAEPALNPQINQAYAALQAGRADEAQRFYGQVANAEPKNVDALLGLAAIAAQQGNTEEASRRYLQILELEPRHALAQSGLIALLGRADPLAAESRLRQLISREPGSAYLHFTLGNIYADQSQWAQAQQAYYQAHHLEQTNPDYAYNLAVALEHLSQPKLALGFYQRAMELAAARGRANFNLSQTRDRVGRLASQVQ